MEFLLENNLQYKHLKNGYMLQYMVSISNILWKYIFTYYFLVKMVQVLLFLGKYCLFMLCIHNIELNILPWWQITQKLALYGMPEYCQIYLIIIGKLIITITCTIICSRCNIIRKIFGMRSIERKKCHK